MRRRYKAQLMRQGREDVSARRSRQDPKNLPFVIWKLEGVLLLPRGYTHRRKSRVAGARHPEEQSPSCDNPSVAVATDISALIRQLCRDAGFDASGVAAVRPEDLPELAYFEQWVEEGRAGEMDYLKKRDEQGRLKRGALDRAAPWARSVTVVACNYNA